jgi:hypothetical protein
MRRRRDLLLSESMVRVEGAALGVRLILFFLDIHESR